MEDSKETFERFGHEFTIKNEKKNCFVWNLNAQKMIPICNRSWWEKHFAFNLGFDLKKFPCSKKQILFWKQFCSLNEKSISLPCPRELVFSFFLHFYFYYLGLMISDSQQETGKLLIWMGATHVLTVWCKALFRYTTTNKQYGREWGVGCTISENLGLQWEFVQTSSCKLWPSISM